MTSPLRVAVFNDSPTVRAAIRAALEREPDMQVVTEQASGDNAAAVVARSQADAVVMDVVMPGVDGYQATREIMRHHPTPIVMVSSVVDARDAAVVFAALEAGALHIAEPPPPPGAAGYALRCAAFAELLRTVAGAKLTRLSAARAPAPTPAPTPAARAPAAPVHPRASAPCLIDVIGIVASAGGPQALSVLLRALPAGVMPPILLVQHLAAGFVASFASWLSGSTGHPVTIAEHGQRAVPGVVYMPPDDHHIGLTADLRIDLDGAGRAVGFRPSGDHLFTSLAQHGRRALGVVLSGMGHDGAEGAVRLRHAGGHVVAQALASAAITGMPSAVSRSGAAEAMLAPADIASWLASKSGVL